MLWGCGTSATSHDGGRDATAADGGAADVPVGSDLAPDLMPDLAPDLAPDLGIPCGDGGECTMGGTCCSSFCVNTGKDPRNCGACGKTCASAEFCTGTSCNGLSFANVCDNPNVIVVKDPFDTDNSAASKIGAALMSGCMPAPMVVEKDQSAEGVLDPAGRPLAGGSVSYVTGGGAFGQHLIDYMDKTALTPVYLFGDADKLGFRVRTTGQDAISAPRAMVNDGHDYFLVEVSVEPIDGSLSIAAMGLLAPGTSAAGYFVPTEMIPKRATYPDTWYVFEWTDSGDKTPDATDTFTMVAHGR
jgi:hypothetical protein